VRRPFWGRVNCNVAPRPEFAVAHTRPPCDSTTERVIANPILGCFTLIHVNPLRYGLWPCRSPTIDPTSRLRSLLRRAFDR